MLCPLCAGDVSVARQTAPFVKEQLGKRRASYSCMGFHGSRSIDIHHPTPSHNGERAVAVFPWRPRTVARFRSGRGRHTSLYLSPHTCNPEQQQLTSIQFILYRFILIAFNRRCTQEGWMHKVRAQYSINSIARLVPD